MRLLIAPDKFKGSLTAPAAAKALADGWRSGWPVEIPLEVRLLPVADGGEGTADTIREALGGSWVSCRAHDPLGREIDARYAMVEPRTGLRVAVIEMSEASGLWRLKEGERDPLHTSTFGCGELLRHAVEETGAGQVLLGLGGSATNDGGVGLATALGYRFLDAEGRTLGPDPSGLHALEKIVPPDVASWRLPPGRLLVACDVRNPLLGERGATRVFGPQKGLVDRAGQDLLEAGLRRLAEVLVEMNGIDSRDVPGAGAAGGLGFGLLAFCGAQLRPGFDVVAELIALEAAVAWSDVVLTGEGGALDEQTLEGKAPLGVAQLARRYGKRVLAFAGSVEPMTGLATQFDELVGLRSTFPDLTKEECLARAAELLRTCAEQAAVRNQR